MAHKFDWGTPKQIQQAAETPRAPRRKRLSNKGRRKGVKARLDELESAMMSLKRAKEYVAHAEVRQDSDSWWVRHMRESLSRAQLHYDMVRAALIKDGITPTR